uniref:FERM domain-containing protein n=1 Tax=Macrostomum lignano TaxID=282301 RepID=A0A1I8HPE4_9PLAT
MRVSENVEDDKQVKELKLILARYLPPDYHNSAKEKHNKLWHTPFYDNELKLKQMYVKLCKKLPSYGCKIYQVKEIQRGNLQRKQGRLLGISEEKIVLLDSKSKALIRSQPVSELRHWHLGNSPINCVELDFQSCKPWNLVCSSEDVLRSLSLALWEVLECDGI